MTGYGTLLRLTVLNRLAGFRSGSMKKEDGRWDKGKIATLVSVMLCGVLLLGFVIFLEWMIYQGLAMFRHPELLPTLALLFAMVGTLLMSFFTVLSSLFFSRDSVWMAYLPVKSRTVLCAKLTEIWAGETLINAAILLPALIMYGTHIGAGVLFYARAALMVLLAPLLPMAIITVLSSVLARVVGGIRNSALLTTFLSFLMIALIYGAEIMFFSTTGDDADTLQIVQLLVQQEGLLQTITGFFPPVYWGVKGLMGDAGYLLLFAAVSIGSLALVMLLMGGRYLELCIRQTEQGASRKRVRLGTGAWRMQSTLRAMVQLEWREIVRSSVNLTQCLAGGIAFPLVFAIMLVSGSASEDFAQVGPALHEWMGMFPQSDLVLGVTAILAFVTFNSPAACTAISREGARHALCRMLPASARTMLRAKLICSLGIDVLSMLVTLLVLVFGLHLPWTMLLAAVLLTMVMRYGAVALMLTIDAVHPQLNWTTETQAIKQNTNVFFGMLLDLVLLALPVVAVVLLWPHGELVRFGAAAVIIVAEAAAGVALLHTVAEKRYAALEP